MVEGLVSVSGVTPVFAMVMLLVGVCMVVVLSVVVVWCHLQDWVWRVTDYDDL